MIGVTEPRRVAAVNMSKRVATEMNVDSRYSKVLYVTNCLLFIPFLKFCCKFKLVVIQLYILQIYLLFVSLIYQS